MWTTIQIQFKQQIKVGGWSKCNVSTLKPFLFYAKKRRTSYSRNGTFKGGKKFCTPLLFLCYNVMLTRYRVTSMLFEKYDQRNKRT